MARVVRAGYERLALGEPSSHEPTVAETIARGETDKVEFKSTARFNTHTQAADARLEQAVRRGIELGLVGEETALPYPIADSLIRHATIYRNQIEYI